MDKYYVANVFYDRVRESSTTTGTGNFTLAGAWPGGFRTFTSTVGVGNNCFYTIVNAISSEWEVGIGTLSDSTTLTRDVILSSSNSNSIVTFSSGTKDVFVSAAASPLNDAMSGLINSGRIGSGQIGWVHMSSGSIRSGHLADGAVNSGNLGSGSVGWVHMSSGSVRSGHLANGAVGSGNLGSGQVGWVHMSSGSIRSGHIANAAVTSGNIQAGAIGSDHISSGARVWGSYSVTCGTFNAGENISAFTPVYFKSDGSLGVAMASVPSRMPAVGIINSAISAGLPVEVFTSIFTASSEDLGQRNAPVYVGRSGGFTTASSGGFVSGDIIQSVGNVIDGLSIFGHIHEPIESGLIGTTLLAAGAVQSGNIGSGQIGQHHFANPLIIGNAQISSGIIGTLTVSGAVGIGLAPSSVDFLKVSKTYTDPGAVVSQIRAVSQANTITADDAASVFIGIWSDVRVDQNGRNLSTAAAIRGAQIGAFAQGNSGTVTDCEGLFIQAGITGSGNLTNSWGIQVASATRLNGGSISGAAGIAINEQNSATNNTILLLGTTTIPAGNYSLYNSSPKPSYFAQNVGIGILPTSGGATSLIAQSGIIAGAAVLSGALTTYGVATLSSLVVSGNMVVDGVTSLGGANAVSALTPLIVGRSFSDPSATSVQQININNTGNTLTSNNANIFIGYAGTINLDQAGFNATNTVGLRGLNINTLATGNSGIITGVAVQTLGFGNQGSGGITNCYGTFYNNATNSAGGVISGVAAVAIAEQTRGVNNVGLLLGTTTVGSGNYSVYSASINPSFFTNGIGIGANPISGGGVSLITNSGIIAGTANISGNLRANGNRITVAGTSPRFHMLDVDVADTGFVMGCNAASFSISDATDNSGSVTNTLFNIDRTTGSCALGYTGATASTNAGILVGRTFVDPTGTVSQINISSTAGGITSNNANVFVGYGCNLRVNATGNSLTGGVRGVDSSTYANGSSGIVASTYGGRFVAGNIASGGGVTVAVGVLAEAIQGTAFAIVSGAAGVVIADQTVGVNNTNLLLGTTTIPAGNYGIYNNSVNPNYFANGLGIGVNPISGGGTSLIMNSGLTAGAVNVSGGLTIQRETASMGIGTAPSSGRMITMDGTIADTSGIVRAIDLTSRAAAITINTAADFTAMYAGAYVLGTNTKNWTSTIGVGTYVADSRLLSGGTGIITNMQGLYTLNSNQGDIGVTNMYGIRVTANTNTGNSGTISGNVGIAIVEQTTGTNNTDLVIGATVTATSGNWGIRNISAYPSHLANNIASIGSNATILSGSDILTVAKSHTDATGTVAQIRINASDTITSNNAQVHCGININNFNFNQNGQPLTATVGVRGVSSTAVATGSSGTVTGVAAYVASFGNAASGGTVTNAYGMFLNAASATANAVVTNAVGIAIGNQSTGTNNAHLIVGGTGFPTGDWGIYQASTEGNHLGGNTDISGSLTATNDLIANDTITAMNSIFSNSGAVVCAASLDIRQAGISGFAVMSGSTGDSYCLIWRTDGAGAAPFNNAGSMIYRTRNNVTAGRSSHFFHTGSGAGGASPMRVSINELGNVGIGIAAASGALHITSGILQIAGATPNIFLQDTSVANTGFAVYCDAASWYVGRQTDAGAITANLLQVDYSGNVTVGQGGATLTAAVKAGIGTLAVISGSTLDVAGVLTVSGSVQANGFSPSWTLITEEIISGMRAVQISQSGYLRIAMASVSGRMPAVGIVKDNILSGQAATVYIAGNFQFAAATSGNFSGYIGRPVIVGRSGHIVTVSGGFNSGGLTGTGDLYQRLGFVANATGIIANIGDMAWSGTLFGNLNY